MSQRIFISVPERWPDDSILMDWIKRLPKGSEVLYRPWANADGVDELGEIIEEAGGLPASLPGDEHELPRGERLDAVIVFAPGPALLFDFPLLLSAWARGVRSTLVPLRSAPRREPVAGGPR